ncbi:uncharacterized protein LOC111596607 [Drosophila hydei]|uniref:Uncharacterized protein LOC111596607 n=1 Tax=Drosophila hydei TaxID=7224 RepID=A0A6J1LL97_DROHY|nr:uncharacterized protein LOC111596607 [Drosophila hydei]
MNLIKWLLPLLGYLVGCQGSSKVIDSAELVTNPCQEIRLAGFVCVDCSTLGFCSHVDGQWQTVSMTTCQSERGFFCNDEGSIGCTWQPKCQVPVRGKFYCQQPGIFPDPYDCRSYHECSEQNVDTPRQCTNGAAYSLLTNSCSLPRESELCSEKQYTCNYVGQTGAWAAHKSYYYICQKDKVGTQDVFYPLMMKCSDGYSFNNHSCVSDAKLKQTEPAKLLADCEEGVVYPADTAEGYFYCVDGQRVYQSCAVDHYFDPVTGICLKESKTCEEGNFYAAETKYGFNVCANGQLIYQRCPAGSVYDPSRNTCRKEQETCEESKLYAAETKHGYLLCQNGQLMSYECPKGSIFDGISAVCEPEHI